MTQKLALYIGRLLQCFPRALFAAAKRHGATGVYLAFCEYVLRTIPFPVRLGNWGIVRTRNESMNYFDNFLLEELRCKEVEAAISAAQEDPVVIDLGINTGVTVRWWFSLNPTSKVIGVDMLQETLDYTTGVLRDVPPTGTWVPICCGVGDHVDPEVEISIDSPLEGTSSILGNSGGQRRKIRMDTLDNLIAPLGVKRVTLLKCDIEGFGGYAFKGAPETLKITDYIVTETHDAAETMLISKVLSRAGFVIFRVFGKMLWWCRDSESLATSASPVR